MAKWRHNVDNQLVRRQLIFNPFPALKFGELIPFDEKIEKGDWEKGLVNSAVDVAGCCVIIRFGHVGQAVCDGPDSSGNRRLCSSGVQVVLDCEHALHKRMSKENRGHTLWDGFVSLPWWVRRRPSVSVASPYGQSVHMIEGWRCVFWQEQNSICGVFRRSSLPVRRK